MLVLDEPSDWVLVVSGIAAATLMPVNYLEQILL